ncbi:hypothetical protein CCH79_00019637 [Gambusia affinis]|uniref:Uncharacterized protein n=1 Tax=Gambusia affinis TaxID=33528 RepID=A0A315W3R3_GAMAF|nr:hypothetical protein CCH79_00019637 [Gambusia affinis]
MVEEIVDFLLRTAIWTFSQKQIRMNDLSKPIFQFQSRRPDGSDCSVSAATAHVGPVTDEPDSEATPSTFRPRPPQRRRHCFRKEWVKSFPFLRYSPRLNVMWCHVCRVHADSFCQNHRLIKGSNHFTKSNIRKHTNTVYHQQNMQRFLWSSRTPSEEPSDPLDPPAEPESKESAGVRAPSSRRPVLSDRTLHRILPVNFNIRAAAFFRLSMSFPSLWPEEEEEQRGASAQGDARRPRSVSGPGGSGSVATVATENGFRKQQADRQQPAGPLVQGGERVAQICAQHSRKIQVSLPEIRKVFPVMKMKNQFSAAVTAFRCLTPEP